MAERLSALIENEALKNDLIAAEEFFVKRDYTEAHERYQTALLTAEKAMGRDSPIVGDICCILSGLCEETRKDYTKAAALLTRAYAITVAELDNDSAAAGKILYNLGRLYKILGVDEMAIDAYQLALESIEKDVGPEHPVVGSIYSSLGDLFERQGDKQTAHDYFLKAQGIFNASPKTGQLGAAQIEQKIKRLIGGDKQAQ